MSGLSDELREVKQQRGAIPKLQLALDAMSEADRAEVFEVMNDRAFSAKAISNALQKRGHDVTEQAISRYRTGRFVYVPR